MTSHEGKVKMGAKALKNYTIKAGFHVLDAFDLAFISVKKFEGPTTIESALHNQWKELYE